MKLPNDADLWAISIEPSKASLSFKKKNKAKGHPITFPLLWDKDHAIIDTFGLTDSRYKWGKDEGIPYASTYLIDKNGQVVFAHVALTYSIRPMNNDILKILRTISD